MKKINIAKRWFYVWLHKINISSKVKDLTLNDRKNTIMDQLTFGLTIAEKIKLYNSVKEAFEEKLIEQKQVSLNVLNEVDTFFK